VRWGDTRIRAGRANPLANGIHNIAWSVTDDQGHVDGIGSRFFWVLN